MREESHNSEAKWQLAGSEWAVVTYLDDGEKWRNGRKLPPVGRFYRRRERGMVLVPHIYDNWPTARWSGWTVACVRSPVLGR
jgi:hypothetical protein